jgi:DNA primase
MPASVTDLIKEKLDVVSVLKAYLELQPAGKNFKARCPFHNEKTPSFIVSPDRQSWHCFGCGLGGDIFTFVMRQENLEFPEALRLLAEKAGVELRRFNPAEERLIGVLYDLNEAAAKFFEEQLRAADVAKKYLVERGITPETIKAFRVGWAPNQEEALNLYLLNKNFAPEDIVRAGLGFKTERGMQLDRFRGRIMFPITNHLGKVVGFSGRILPQFDTGNVGKYVNSPETPIFNKSRLLYGYSIAKDVIRDTHRAVLVEGQLDVLMCHQAGITNAIAVSGTALTADHLRSLGRIADTLILAFDQDEAGWAAADRAFDLARQHDFDVRIALLPGVKDPAELAQKDPTALQEALKEASPAMKVYIQRFLLPGASYAERGALQKLRTVLHKLSRSPSAVEREEWLRLIAAHTNLSEHVLREELVFVTEPARDAAVEEVAAEASDNGPANRWEALAERTVMAAFHTNRIADVPLEYLPKLYTNITAILRENKQQSTNAAEDAILRRIVVTLEETGPDEFDELTVQLGRAYVAEQRRRITTRVKEAERKGDEAALEEALTALSQLPHY